MSRAHWGRAWKHARTKAKDRAGWRCERCGKAGRLEVHHRVPVAEGGPLTDQDNLIVLCRACHFSEHHAISLERAAWRQLMQSGCQ